MVKHSTCITLCRAIPSFSITFTLGYLSSPSKWGTAAVGKIELLCFSQKCTIYNKTFISILHITRGTIRWCKRHQNATAPFMLKINQMKPGRVVIWDFWTGIFFSQVHLKSKVLQFNFLIILLWFLFFF